MTSECRAFYNNLFSLGWIGKCKISFFLGYKWWNNKCCVKLVWTSLEPVLTSWKHKTKGDWPPIFTKNSIIRNFNRDCSCEQAIFVLHDPRVDYMTEQLYFYPLNSPICSDNNSQNQNLDLRYWPQNCRKVW